MSRTAPLSHARRAGETPVPAPGVFTVSLDFELYWGVRDHRSLEGYRAHLEGVRPAVRAMLALFAEFGVHATWASVGMLFANDLDELESVRPAVLPAYADGALSPYAYIDAEGRAAIPRDAALHFAPELLEEIARVPGQTIGTHTFSHFYCLERGQDGVAFAADLAAATELARRRGRTLKSIVFPRNQVNPSYLPLLAGHGIETYRGMEGRWPYTSTERGGETLPLRAVRLLDTYVNLTGQHTHAIGERAQARPVDVPSSRFLRPVSRRLRALEPLRRRRIVRGIRHAARTGRIYHLWWHPHNFGVELAANTAFLRSILECVAAMRERHGMRCLNMEEIGELCAARAA